MNRQRARQATLAIVLMVTASAVGCDPLPRHPENDSLEIDILVAGDSYTAGNNATSDAPNDGYFESDKSADDPRSLESVRQRPTGVGTRGCFRSHNNYGQQLYDLLQSSGAYINAACSGDTTDNIIGVNDPPQLDGFTEDQREEVDVIALTIGGNDLGFKDIVQWCFTPTTRSVLGCQASVDSARDMLEPNDGPYSTLYFLNKGALQSIGENWPNAKIVLVGYPLIVEDDEYELEVCSLCEPYRPVPDLRYGLSLFNQQMDVLAEDLNTQFPDKFTYLPLHNDVGTGLFDGHGLGGDLEPWLREPETSAYLAEWVHPTTEGHSAIANALAELPAVQQLFGPEPSFGHFMVDCQSHLWLGSDFSDFTVYRTSGPDGFVSCVTGTCPEAPEGLKNVLVTDSPSPPPLVSVNPDGRWTSSYRIHQYFGEEQTWSSHCVQGRQSAHLVYDRDEILTWPTVQSYDPVVMTATSGTPLPEPVISPSDVSTGREIVVEDPGGLCGADPNWRYLGFAASVHPIDLGHPPSDWEIITRYPLDADGSWGPIRVKLPVLDYRHFIIVNVTCIAADENGADIYGWGTSASIEPAVS